MAAKAPRSMTLAEKLSFYSMPEPNSGCFLWLGAVNNKGYGLFNWAGRLQLAHRLAWEVVNGPIPDGKWALHRCDVPSCINPAHLRTGSHTDNMRDMVAKGRGRGGRSLGERHGLAKLTDEAVREIRSLYGTMTRREIAARFGVHRNTVERVLCGSGWRHI